MFFLVIDMPLISLSFNRSLVEIHVVSRYGILLVFEASGPSKMHVWVSLGNLVGFGGPVAEHDDSKYNFSSGVILQKCKSQVLRKVSHVM